MSNMEYTVHVPVTSLVWLGWLGGSWVDDSGLALLCAALACSPTNSPPTTDGWLLLDGFRLPLFIPSYPSHVSSENPHDLGRRESVPWTRSWVPAMRDQRELLTEKRKNNDGNGGSIDVVLPHSPRWLSLTFLSKERWIMHSPRSHLLADAAVVQALRVSSQLCNGSRVERRCHSLLFTVASSSIPSLFPFRFFQCRRFSFCLYSNVVGIIVILTWFLTVFLFFFLFSLVPFHVSFFLLFFAFPTIQSIIVDNSYCTNLHQPTWGKLN